MIPFDVATVPARLRRPLARGLQVVAVVGAIVSLSVGVVGWQVVGQVDDVAVEGAAVTADALRALEETLGLAAELVDSVDTTLVALEDGLGTATGSVGDGADALDSVARLADDAAPALASATRTLRSLEEVGGSIDRALEGLAALPFGPEYDPDQGLGVTAGALADDLEPLSLSFARTAADLDAVADSSDQLEQDLDELTEAVAAATTQLTESQQLIEDYRDAADRAGGVSEVAGSQLENDLVLLRVLLLVGGIVFALAQVVPWLIGRSLLVGTATT